MNNSNLQNLSIDFHLFDYFFPIIIVSWISLIFKMQTSSLHLEGAPWSFLFIHLFFLSLFLYLQPKTYCKLLVLRCSSLFTESFIPDFFFVFFFLFFFGTLLPAVNEWERFKLLRVCISHMLLHVDKNIQKRNTLTNILLIRTTNGQKFHSAPLICIDIFKQSMWLYPGRIKVL